jgi:Arc/MetJ-type ribon-helix-helix transcriptional regulator
MRYRITVELKKGDREKIEAVIKNEYPKLKNISDVVREALKDLFKNRGY